MDRFLKKIALFFVLVISLQAVAAAQNDYRRGLLWEKEIAAFATADKKDFPKKEKRKLPLSKHLKICRMPRRG